MLRGLIVSMALASVVVTAIYGRAWISASARLLGTSDAGATGWFAALASCVLLSWGLEALHRPRGQAHP